MFYRVTYKNIGIYEALRKSVSYDIWKSLLNSNKFNWLPKPPKYLGNYESYFTTFGFNKFYELVLPICKQYLNTDLIKIISFRYLQHKIIYQDDYQVVVNNMNAFKSKFNQVYLDIINEDSCTPYNEYKILTKNLKQLYPIKHTFLDLNEIINETIKTPELTPVPDEVLIECYKNLNKISNECFKISYQKIINIVNNSSYLLSDIFTKCLNKYANDKSGNLYIIKTDIDTNLTNIENNITYQKLIKIIPDQVRVIQFLNILINSKLNKKNLNGLTVIKRQINIEKYKDCLIFIENSNKSFKDTFEHEFTHFIQRICMFDPNLPMIYNHNLDIVINKNFIKIINNIIKFFKYSDKDKLNIFQWNLYNFINDKFKQTEQHQSIKSMIKFFIRTYELDDTKYFINHTYYSINQIENFSDKDFIINFRLKWLNKFINYINSYEIFNNSLMEDYLNDKISETREITLLLFSIIYLVTKYEYIEYNIDNNLINEFKIFKFRDF